MLTKTTQIDMEKLNALRAGVTAPDSVTFQALRIQIRYKGPTTARKGPHIPSKPARIAESLRLDRQC